MFRAKFMHCSSLLHSFSVLAIHYFWYYCHLRLRCGKNFLTLNWSYTAPKFRTVTMFLTTHLRKIFHTKIYAHLFTNFHMPFTGCRRETDNQWTITVCPMLLYIDNIKFYHIFQRPTSILQLRACDVSPDPKVYEIAVTNLFEIV
jgi:hypothetical protein